MKRKKWILVKKENKNRKKGQNEKKFKQEKKSRRI